jgi:hypothetical protein
MFANQFLTRIIAGALVLSGVLFWAGCDSGGTGSTAQGDFTLRLVDAPADLDSAVVTVNRVELFTEDGVSDDENGDDDSEDDDDSGDDDSGDDDENTLTLTEETRQLDLLQLQNGNEEILADEVTVPEGEYTQLRLVLGSDNYVVVNGEQQMLQVPSGQQSGIKIILPEVEIENDGDQIDLTLDFDVEDSFIEQGNGTYRFKPTIKVKDVFVNGQSIETVSVEGLVTSVDAGNGGISVEEVAFTTTTATEIEGDNVSALGDFSEGQYVEVEGTLLEDGTAEAREIETEESDDERSITARVESKTSTEQEQSLTLLGVAIQVTSNTEFDDSSFGVLEAGDRVEVDYTVDSNNNRLATQIENEGD